MPPKGGPPKRSQSRAKSLKSQSRALGDEGGPEADTTEAAEEEAFAGLNAEAEANAALLLGDRGANTSHFPVEQKAEGDKIALLGDVGVKAGHYSADGQAEGDNIALFGDEGAKAIHCLAEEKAGIVDPCADPAAKDDSFEDLQSKLVRAIMDGDSDSMTMLLDEGASANGAGGESDFSLLPLMVAAEHNISAIGALMEARADVNATSKIGETVLYGAVEASKVEAARELLNARADPCLYTVKEAGLKSVLHRAAFYNVADIVMDLVESRADLEFKDYMSRTPLHIAVSFGQVEVMQKLLEARADAEAKDLEEKNSLLLAVECGQVEALRYLVENRCVNTEDPDIPWTEIIKRPDEVPAVLFRAIQTEPENKSEVKKWLRKAYLGGSPKGIFAPKLLRITKAEDNGPMRQRELLLPQGAAELSVLASLKQVKPCAATLVYLSMFHPCSTRIIRALSETPNEELFLEKTTMAIVGHAWVEMQPWYMCEIFWAILVLLSMLRIAVDLSSQSRASTIYLVVIGLQVFKKTSEEVSQIYIRGHELRSHRLGLFLYWSSLGSWADWCTAGVYIAAILFAHDYSGTTVQRAFLGAAGAMTWLTAMYSLRGVRYFGARMLPIIWAMRDTMTFCVIMAFCLGAVSHAYYFTGAQSGDPHPVYASASRMYRLGFLSDFDLQDLEGLSTNFALQDDQWVPVDSGTTSIEPLVHGIFYITSMMMTIVMMNILIAILGHNYDSNKDRADLIFLRERANMITAMRASPFRRLLCLVLRPLLRGMIRRLHNNDMVQSSGKWRHTHFSTRMLRAMVPLGLQRTTYSSWKKDQFLWFGMRADVSSGPDVVEEVRTLREKMAAQAAQVNDRLERIETLMNKLAPAEAGEAKRASRVSRVVTGASSRPAQAHRR